jgi:hypothetical protein
VKFEEVRAADHIRAPDHDKVEKGMLLAAVLRRLSPGAKMKAPPSNSSTANS